MKVAVFSDVHGNLTALDAVLADIATHRPDITYFAGDLCLFGARPVETLRRLASEAHILLVAGNADVDVVEAARQGCEPEPDDHDFKHASARWAAERLEPEDLRYLDSMAFSHRVSPTMNSTDDLIVTHANPADHYTFIAPPESEQLVRLGQVALPHEPERIDELLVGVDAGAVAYGHFHFPNTQRVGQTLLVNASSVSNPMDRDPRAKYAILEWTPARSWETSTHRVHYDRSGEHDALERNQPPNWQLLSRILDGELYLGEPSDQRPNQQRGEATQTGTP